ncbi:MAG: nucleotidyltransferase [Sodaliphilus pleomorphus]|jgi:dTDP-glucose pyrophosphorylase|uniref:nucleotidyltransferase n=1 Tax=Sodaliphilus pleomorphus TaxID=2606626 RepID=UPI0023F53B49|nr:nucleotidyltransferase [Sodaliphilus pleomorphus]MDD7066642.1 nucleotidyltransferase [Sodaliphilus pleomorphus]MDY2833252.1 nucleotidyltransferase [Sodaliphilus pleomorphus]
MKPTLFVLAAGMGSRYGGLKQLDGLGPHGETIMDYSIYDAIHAGFGKVVFVIRKDFEDDFRSKILSKYEGHIPVEVVFQSIQDLPEGFTCPAGRTKPWGTNHALLMGRNVIKEPFAIINSDDYYGRNSFEVMAQELSNLPEGSKHNYSMLGFKVGNTMSESGSVSRGVCETVDGYLTGIVERTSIAYDENHNIFFDDEQGHSVQLAPDTPVSMNFWGFTPDYFDYSEQAFVEFLKAHINEPKSEFFIPTVVNRLISEKKARVKVLKTDSKWFGVTYSADRQGVVDKFAALHDSGFYPDSMF